MIKAALIFIKAAFVSQQNHLITIIMLLKTHNTLSRYSEKSKNPYIIKDYYTRNLSQSYISTALLTQGSYFFDF